jgi:hypothetical protein
MLLNLRNNTNERLFFYAFLSADESYGQMASFPACIQKIGDSNVGPNTVSPQIIVVYLNPSRQIHN